MQNDIITYRLGYKEIPGAAQWPAKNYTGLYAFAGEFYDSFISFRLRNEFFDATNLI